MLYQLASKTISLRFRYGHNSAQAGDQNSLIIDADRMLQNACVTDEFALVVEKELQVFISPLQRMRLHPEDVFSPTEELFLFRFGKAGGLFDFQIAYSPQPNLITLLVPGASLAPITRADNLTGLQPVPYSQKPAWKVSLSPALTGIFIATTRLTTIAPDSLCQGMYLAVNSSLLLGFAPASPDTSTVTKTADERFSYCIGVFQSLGGTYGGPMSTSDTSAEKVPLSS